MSTVVQHPPHLATTSIPRHRKLPPPDHANVQPPEVETPAASLEPASLPSWGELAKVARQKLLGMVSHERTCWKTLAGILVAIVAVASIPLPHIVTCNVVCEPVLRRYVSAPFDARLTRSHVRVGQRVSEGELLATLDGAELRSQLAAVLAKLAQSEQRELAALAAGDHSKAELERWEVEHLGREADLLRRRQSSLEIRSPIDGVVVTGDLERAEGAPLSMGDSLFEIASLEHIVAEIAIPEEEVAFVTDELPVSIVVDANPSERLYTSINRIHVRGEILDNENVFIAEAELPNTDSQIRPGMNATAAIDAGYKSLGWQLFHRPYYAARKWIGW